MANCALVLGFMAMWSVVNLLTYLVHDHKTMLVARFFLGITEAPARSHHHDAEKLKSLLFSSFIRVLCT